MDLLEAIAEEAGPAFSRAEFAEPASWTPAGGAAVEMLGVFDRISEVTELGELLQNDGVAATFMIATADAPGVAIADRLLVRGTDYGIYGIEPDGTGHTRLVLSI